MEAPYVVVPVDGQFNVGSDDTSKVAPQSEASVKLSLGRLLSEFLIRDEKKIRDFAKLRPFLINKSTLITPSFAEKAFDMASLENFNSLLMDNVRDQINDRVKSMALLSPIAELDAMDLEALHKWLYWAAMVSKFSRLAGSFDIPYGVVFIDGNSALDSDTIQKRTPKTVPTVVVSTLQEDLVKIYVLVAIRNTTTGQKMNLSRPYGYVHFDDAALAGKPIQYLYHEYRIMTSRSIDDPPVEVKITQSKYPEVRDLEDLPPNYPTHALSKVENLTEVIVPSVDQWLPRNVEPAAGSNATIPSSVLSQGLYMSTALTNVKKYIWLSTKEFRNMNETTFTAFEEGRLNYEIERKFITEKLIELRKDPTAKTLASILPYKANDLDAADVTEFIKRHEAFLKELDTRFGPPTSTSPPQGAPAGKGKDPEKDKGKNPEKGKGKGKTAKPTGESESSQPKQEKDDEKAKQPTKPTPTKANEGKPKKETPTVTPEQTVITKDVVEKRLSVFETVEKRLQVFEEMKKLDESGIIDIYVMKNYTHSVGERKPKRTIGFYRDFISQTILTEVSDEIFESDELAIFYKKPSLETYANDTRKTGWTSTWREIGSQILLLENLEDVQRQRKEWDMERKPTNKTLSQYLDDWGLNEDDYGKEIWRAIMRNLGEKTDLVKQRLDDRAKEIEEEALNKAADEEKPEPTKPSPLPIINNNLKKVTDENSDDEGESFEDVDETNESPPASPREPVPKIDPTQAEGNTTDDGGEKDEEFASTGPFTPRLLDSNSPILDSLLRLFMVDVVAASIGTEDPIRAINEALLQFDAEAATAALFSALSSVYTGIDTHVNIRFQRLGERIGSERQRSIDLAPYLKSPLSIADSMVIAQFFSPALDKALGSGAPFGIIPDGKKEGGKSSIFGVQAIVELCRETNDLRRHVPVSSYYHPLGQDPRTTNKLVFDLSETVITPEVGDGDKVESNTNMQWKLIWFQAWRTQLFESYVSRLPPFAETFHRESASVVKAYKPENGAVASIVSVSGFRDVVIDTLKGGDRDSIYEVNSNSRRTDYVRATGLIGGQDSWNAPILGLLSIPNDNNPQLFKHRIGNATMRAADNQTIKLSPVDEAYGLLSALSVVFSTMSLAVLEIINPVVLVDILTGTYPVINNPFFSFATLKSLVVAPKNVFRFPQFEKMMTPALASVDNKNKDATQWSSVKSWLVLLALNFAARYRLGPRKFWTLLGETPSDEVSPILKATSFNGKYALFRDADCVVATILSGVAEGKNVTDTWESISRYLSNTTNETIEERLKVLQPNKIDVVNFIRSAVSAEDPPQS